MCWSATANFVGGGLVAGVGVATLAKVEQPRELVLGSLPLAFGIHQVLEGFVWLGLQGRAPLGLGSEAAGAYVFYAQGLLPLLGPLSVALVSPPERRRWLWPFVAAGAVLAAYISYTLANHHVTVEIAGNSLNYRNPGISALATAIAYVVLTVGPFLVSGRRFLVAFGVLNLLGIITVLAVKAYAFTSVWCAYAAVVSVVLFGYFRTSRASQRDLLAS